MVHFYYVYFLMVPGRVILINIKVEMLFSMAGKSIVHVLLVKRTLAVTGALVCIGFAVKPLEMTKRHLQCLR